MRLTALFTRGFFFLSVKRQLYVYTLSSLSMICQISAPPRDRFFCVIFRLFSPIGGVQATKPRENLNTQNHDAMGAQNTKYTRMARMTRKKRTIVEKFDINFDLCMPFNSAVLHLNRTLLNTCVLSFVSCTAHDYQN